MFSLVVYICENMFCAGELGTTPFKTLVNLGLKLKNFSVKVSAGRRPKKKRREFNWKVKSGGKRFHPLNKEVKRVYRVSSCMLGKSAITVEQFTSTSKQHFFNSLSQRTKQRTWQMAQLLRPALALCGICLSFSKLILNWLLDTCMYKK